MWQAGTGGHAGCSPLLQLGMPSDSHPVRTLWHDPRWPKVKSRQRYTHAPEGLVPGVHLSDLSGGSDSSLGDLMLISCAMIDAWLAYLLRARTCDRANCYGPPPSPENAANDKISAARMPSSHFTWVCRQQHHRKQDCLAHVSVHPQTRLAAVQHSSTP